MLTDRTLSDLLHIEDFIQLLVYTLSGDLHIIKNMIVRCSNNQELVYRQQTVVIKKINHFQRNA